ncbi:hypothetical protein D3C71_1595240 [compost metagenome]
MVDCVHLVMGCAVTPPQTPDQVVHLNLLGLRVRVELVVQVTANVLVRDHCCNHVPTVELDALAKRRDLEAAVCTHAITTKSGKRMEIHSDVSSMWGSPEICIDPQTGHRYGLLGSPSLISGWCVHLKSRVKKMRRTWYDTLSLLKSRITMCWKSPMIVCSFSVNSWICLRAI